MFPFKSALTACNKGFILRMFLAVWIASAILPLVGAGMSSASAAKSAPASAANGYEVYVIPIKQTVASGLEAFVNRGLKQAEEAQAALVVFDIDTPGGSLASAERIGERIRSAKIPTMAYVSGKAASAGAYVTLNTNRILMSPGSTLGAAMVVDSTGAPVKDAKIVPHWRSEMVAAAELNKRNPDIAAGMVDPDLTVELKELGKTKDKGEVISLSAEEALKVGYSDGKASSVTEAIGSMGLGELMVEYVEPSLAERISQFVTTPAVSTLLMIIGIAGILIELIVPGFGAPGITGLLAFGLYFFGQSIAGFAGKESIVLFVAGIVFLVLEMFVPSFGILGILGGAGIVSGVVTAAYDTGDAFASLGWASLVAVLIVAVVAYIFRRRGVWNRFILQDELTAEQGYVPNSDDRGQWLGKRGIAVTGLRPAGIAEIEGVRVDVVTTGEFIVQGSDIKVVNVDGTRVVVTASQDNESL